MRFELLKSRIVRLEAKRHGTRFDHLDREGLERELFIRVHRLAAQAGGIDGLLAEWDEANDPKERALIDKIRPYLLSVRDHYAEMEARFCSAH